MRDIGTGNDDDDDADYVQCETSIANPNQTINGPETTTVNKVDAILDAGVKRRNSTKEDEKNAPIKEHTLNGIIGHEANKIWQRRYAKYGDTFYRVQWYDCRPDENT